MIWNSAMKASLAIYLGLGLLSPGTAAPLDDPTKPKLCETGHQLEPETPPGGYNFSRESWERAFNNAFAYYACVENNDPTRDLYVNWHIPKILGVIPFHDSITKSRIYADHPTVTVHGCLIYGNNREVMKADFLGHPDETTMAQSEGDCRDLRPKVHAANVPSSGFPSFDVNGRLIFPTNVKDIENTLIRFVYSVGLREADSQYVMSLSYAAYPVYPEKFKGSIGNLRIRPSDKGLNDMWESEGFGKPLTEKQRTFELKLPEPKNGSLVQQSFQIMDLEDTVIDEIPAPFFSESVK
jgi:hypothetical protein